MSKVAVIMGSLSDLPIMQEAIDILKGFDIEVEVDIVSAHRTPDKLYEFSKQAHKNGFAVILAGAEGPAHLPGMVASETVLPVIGVPVATVALNGAKNAGILAAQIIGSTDQCVLDKIIFYKEGLKDKVIKGAQELNKPK